MVNKNIVRSVLLGLILVLADQVLKLSVHLTNPFIDLKIFAIVFVKNTGSLWGWFQNTNSLFIFISLIAIGALLYFYDQFPKKAFLFYLMLLSGIIGNLIDRIFRGFVVDFIDFKFWPVFNLADAFIVVSIIALIIYTWKEKS